MALTGLAALLAGCQPLPHPFADDRPPADLVAVRDAMGVAIAPIQGGPPEVVDKLGSAVAAALVQRDIPAAEGPPSRGSYVLRGRIDHQPADKSHSIVVAYWRLLDPNGQAKGVKSVRIKLTTRDWEAGEEQAVRQLATESAAAVAGLMEEGEAAPKGNEPTPVNDVRPRLAIRHISGAPGDGAESLAKAAAAVLQRQGIAIAESGDAKVDFYLDAELAVEPVKPDKQHIKITWRLVRPDGAEIGTVGQENDIPRGMVDGSWGDLAYSVATAAADGLMQLIARAGPAGKS